MKNLPTVTIAVSAYNEEKNIKNFLKSVLKQKLDEAKLEKILVISDGSTDSTVALVQSLNSKIIDIKNYPTRRGLPARLNQICKQLQSDFLVKSDADVIFAHERVLEEIIKPMIKDKNVGMCGGNTQPLKGITFTEKAVNVTHPIYSKFRKVVRGGNNWFSASGRLFVLRKELAKKINYPEDVIGSDRYTYLSCLVLGFRYKYAQNAIVYFRSSQTLKDHIAQNTRFLAIPIRMSKYFDEELVKRETQIPRNLFLKSLGIQFLKHPFLSSYIFAVNRYCQYKAKRIERDLDSIWQIATTTKNLNLEK